MQAHETLALGDPTSGTHSMIVGKPGAGPFKDYADADNQQVICRTKMRVYPVLGSPETTIKVPETDPDYLRLTVQEAFEALVRVPDIRLVRCLVLFDDVHREEPWLRQTVAPEWRVFAETFPEEGEIFLYRPVADDDVSTTLKHEWAHLLQLPSSSGSNCSIRSATLNVSSPAMRRSTRSTVSSDGHTSASAF